jgi:hypothetical protein
MELDLAGLGWRGHLEDVVYGEAHRDRRFHGSGRCAREDIVERTKSRAKIARRQDSLMREM